MHDSQQFSLLAVFFHLYRKRSFEDRYFYTPDAPPVAQLKMSKCWKKRENTESMQDKHRQRKKGTDGRTDAVSAVRCTVRIYTSAWVVRWITIDPELFQRSFEHTEVADTGFILTSTERTLRRQTWTKSIIMQYQSTRKKSLWCRRWYGSYYMYMVPVTEPTKMHDLARKISIFSWNDTPGWPHSFPARNLWAVPRYNLLLIFIRC